MRAVMDEVEIDRGDAGTTIRMVRRPRVPHAPARRHPPGAEGTASVTIDDGGPQRPIAVVTGRHRRRGRGRGGGAASGANAPPTSHLRLDLGAVAYLDSSGVRLLVELAARQAGGGATLTVRAPTGGPVHRVLVLTGLEDAAGLRLEEG